MTEKEIESKLIEYHDLIISTAMKYYLDGMTWEDNYQEFCMLFVSALKNHDETRGADIKTLFIKYARVFVARKLQSDGRKKRGKMIIGKLPDNAEESKEWIDTIIDDGLMPNEVEERERMWECISEFMRRNKNSYLLHRIIVDGETATAIGVEEGVSAQAISMRYKNTLEKLKEYLRKRGFRLE
jgi:RNA polymerase sigma factor (sigma-70 family)